MVIFCFKHKTAYDMRISDWSSDVCSSDRTAFGARRDHRDDPRLGIDVDHQAQRLAEPATAGQLVSADGEETPVARRDQQLVGRLRMRGEQQLVAVLELEFAPLVRRDMTALRARSEEHTSELQSLMRISYA